MVPFLHLVLLLLLAPFIRSPVATVVPPTPFPALSGRLLALAVLLRFLFLARLLAGLCLLSYFGSDGSAIASIVGAIAVAARVAAASVTARAPEGDLREEPRLIAANARQQQRQAQQRQQQKQQ